MFRPTALAAAFAALVALAFDASTTTAVAQNGAAPAAPLMPITLPGDPDRGKVIGQTCAGCHGIPGYFNATPAYHVPKLGGQNADYIEVALQGYRRGTRSHETMQAQAASLSDQDIADVAAYFESLGGEPEKGRSRASAAAVEAGRAKSATCAACHGAEGVAAAPQWPNLAGQHQSYLLTALEQYKDGRRQDLVMGPLVAQFDEQGLEELAAFFAAQAHLYSTEL